MTVDFSQIHNADEIEEREMILAEENAREELFNLANSLEEFDGEGEYHELVEMANLTAENNPLSETAVDLKEQVTIAIMELS